MQTMTAAEAKQRFGQLMDKAQRGPVAITKHGRRVGVFMADDCDVFKGFESEHSVEESLKRASEDIKAGRVSPAEDVYSRIRTNISKWASEQD